MSRLIETSLPTVKVPAEIFKAMGATASDYLLPVLPEDAPYVEAGSDLMDSDLIERYVAGPAEAIAAATAPSTEDLLLQRIPGAKNF